MGKQELAEVDLKETTLVQLNVTEAALTDLEKRHGGVVYNFDDPSEYEVGKSAIKELTTVRTTLDKKRKELNQDDHDRIKVRNELAKKIQARLSSLEDPLKAARKEVDERAEKERQAAIDAEIERQEQEEQAKKDAEAAALKAEQDELAKQKAELAEQLAAVEAEKKKMADEKAAVAAEKERQLLAEERKRAEEVRNAELKKSIDQFLPAWHGFQDATAGLVYEGDMAKQFESDIDAVVEKYAGLMS